MINYYDCCIYTHACQLVFISSCLGHWNDIQCVQYPAASLSTPVLSSTTMLQHNAESFACREHLGVIINTDGMPLFKSSRSTLWPVYLEIGNYPPSIRFRTENTIICGFWIGQSKPDMNMILKPILKVIDNLNILGFSFASPDGMKNVRIKLLFGVFDLIVKAKVLNMNQFNDNCGCPTCLHPGEHQGSRVCDPSKSYPLRTVQGIKEAVRTGIAQKQVVDGIKGPSPLHK